MKKKKWPFVYVAVITVLTYIPILLTVVYSFNASKLTSVWEGFFHCKIRQILLQSKSPVKRAGKMRCYDEKVVGSPLAKSKWKGGEAGVEKFPWRFLVCVVILALALSIKAC